MKRKMILLCLAACLLLSGCSIWNEGHYVSVIPHREQSVRKNDNNQVANTYLELREIMESFVENGTENAVISTPYYPEVNMEDNVQTAISYVLEDHPIGAYAVEEINYEIGTNAGYRAVALEINYRHDYSEIRRIQQVDDMRGAKQKISESLDDCSSGIVLYIKQYEEFDPEQLVSDYATTHPEKVIEQPRVTCNMYPEGYSTTKVVELLYSYETSRDSLRSMQNQVGPMFEAAVLYVSGDTDSHQKFLHMYSFLMERYDYQYQTSITPAYSLLRHGVGDSKAFATVFAAMCSRAGLDCRVVSGTKDGEAWFWNVLYDEKYYHHVDLVECSRQGMMILKPDLLMEGYVWDYSTVPRCLAPTFEPTEPTDSEETVDVTEPHVETTAPDAVSHVISEETTAPVTESLEPTN